MKIHLAVMAFLILLFAGSIAYTVALEPTEISEMPDSIDQSDEYRKGLLFAELYQTALQQYLASTPAMDRQLAEQLALSKAYSEAYDLKLTEEQTREKWQERNLLAEYARENNIYPSEQEIRAYIQVVADSFLHVSPQMEEGVMAGLGITEEQFYFQFMRGSYEEALVRLAIVEELKKKHAKLDDESDSHYHTRMLAEVDKLVVELKGR